MGAGAGGKMGDTNEYTVHDLVRDELYKNMDVEYGKFIASLLPGAGNIIGVVIGQFLGDLIQTENIKKNISEYLTKISFSKGYVSYAKIGQAILNTYGVTDYTNLTVNQSTNNVPITETQIAVLGVLKID